MTESTLTTKEAYLAMYVYLEARYEETKNEYLGGLLGGLSLLDDDSTADPAAWHDWVQAVEQVRQGNFDAYLRFKESSE